MRTEDELRAELARAKSLLRDVLAQYPDTHWLPSQWHGYIMALEWMIPVGKFKMMETRRRQRAEKERADGSR
jgi:hypothetical protein